MLTSATGEEVPDDAPADVRAQAILKKYPDQGRVILLETRSTLTGIERNTNTVLAGLESDKDYVLADSRMTASLGRGRTLFRDIEELRNDVLDLISLAQEEIRLADSYRDEAYQLSLIHI